MCQGLALFTTEQWFQDQGFGFQVPVFGFRFPGFPLPGYWSRFLGSEFPVLGFGGMQATAPESGFKLHTSGAGFRVLGSGFRDSGFGYAD